METKHFEVGTMKLEIHASKKAAGEAAAQSAAQALKQLDQSRSADRRYLCDRRLAAGNVTRVDLHSGSALEESSWLSSG